MLEPASSTILSAYRAILDLPVENVPNVGDFIPIPDFSVSLLLSLCDEAIEIFRKEPMLVELKSPQTIVGDLHGSLHDLLRILKVDDPFKSPFLFLGDYVDRGQFSIEVITILLSLKCQGAKITMIRGNHEFEEVCSKYGFKDEILKVYGIEPLFTKFLEVFSYIPIAATIDNVVFCVHGGISQHLNSMSQLAMVQRPLKDTSIPLIHDIMWSDPSSMYPGYSESFRGDCFVFGIEAVKLFYKKTNMQLIIRAHQYNVDGIKVELNNSVVTVFSASSYKFDNSNKSAILRLNGKNLDKKVFEPYERMKRENAMFFTMKAPNPTKQVNKSSSITLMSSSSSHFSLKNAKQKSRLNIIPNSNSMMSMNLFRTCPQNKPKCATPMHSISTFILSENDE